MIEGEIRMAMTKNSAQAAHYTKEITIQASRESVYRALTTREGLAGWWSEQVQRSEDRWQLYFQGPNHKIDLAIHETIENERLLWLCIEHSTFPEWANTCMVFQLIRQEDGVLVQFEHQGLMTHCACYTSCAQGWDFFLDSLKAYCETGSGTPWQG